MVAIRRNSGMWLLNVSRIHRDRPSKRGSCNMQAAVAAVCVAGILLGGASSATAAGDADRADQRTRVAALKEQAFERLQARRARTLGEAFPERTRVSVYIGIDVESFVLERVAVRIDGQSPVTREYSSAESQSLRNKGLHRILRTNVEPGTHRVHLAFEGRLADSDPDDPPLTGEFELDFKKTERPKAMILPVAPQALRPNRQLDPADWQWRQESTDPRLGMVRYLRARDRRFAAAMELMEIAATDPGDGRPAGYHVLLACSYLDFGMRAQAERALRAYAQRGAEREPYENVRLRLAELDLVRGRLRRSERRLDDMYKHLTSAQRVNWQDLMSRLRMAQGRYARAAEILAKGDDQLEVLTEARQKDNQTLYMRYNHAIAMLRSGRVDKGRTLLDRLGRMKPFNAAHRALRDKANVALGFHFLASEQGATAKEIFQRVRLNGPYSNRALLGLGWSELAPRGERQPRVAVGDEPKAGTYGIADTESGRINRDDLPDRYRPDAFSQVQFEPFRMADIAESDDVGRQRALFAWRKLSRRGIVDPAVQEAMVAAGRAFAKIGDQRAAVQAYEHAITDFASARKRLERALDTLRTNSAVPRVKATEPLSLGRRWLRQQLSALSHTRWLQEFLATQRAQEALANIVDLQFLARALRASGAGYGNGVRPAMALDGFRVRPAGSGSAATADLSSALEAAANSETRRLHSMAADTLVEQRTRMKGYQRAARRGLARINLHSTHGEAVIRGGSDAVSKAVPAED